MTVVVHHVTCAFSGGGGWFLVVGKYYNTFQILAFWILCVNQSYFMSLFFFISAYFSPKSLDRKGRFWFMYDKMKRLGIPTFAWYFGLGPLLVFIGTKMLGRPSEYEYGPSSGPPWFILWLLIFNV